MTDTRDDFDTTDDHVGFFIVPAEHLDELHALEAAAYEAQLRCYEEKQPRRPGWWFYRENQVFERAREVATAVTVIEDGMYVDAHSVIKDWVLQRFWHGGAWEVLSPDDLAAMARELPGIRIDDVLRWARTNRPAIRGEEPLFIELFERLVRMVAAAADSPSGLALLRLHTNFRHPPDLPPSEPLPPEPEPEPVDEDEGALMGWFTVPAEHIPALQAIDAERDAAFRQGRMADFYALETRLFERARAVARIADVFNAWAYKEAYRAWMDRLAPGGDGPAVPAVRDAKARERWAFRAEHPRGVPDLPPGMDNPGDATSRQDRTRARELSEALRRAASSPLAKGCGLVIAWCFAQPPTWPRYDDASRRMAWMRMLELDAVVNQARAGLAAIEARQRRARPRGKDSAKDSANHAARDASPDAARDAVHDDTAAVDEAADQAQSEVQSKAQADLARRFPWLSRLPDHEHVLATLARHIARAQPARVPIALAALLAEDFFAVDTAGEPEIERAGRQAMAEELARHPAWVALVLPRRGKPDVRVYLDGQRLQVHEGGVPADAFFARGRGALLAVQAAWHQGMLDASHDQLQPLYDTYPPLYGKLVGRRFEKMVSDSVMQRLDRDEKREARRARAQRR